MVDQTSGPPQDDSGQASAGPSPSGTTETDETGPPAETSHEGDAGRKAEVRPESSSPDAGAESTPAEGPKAAQGTEGGAAKKVGPPTVIVRYGSMGQLGKFRHDLHQWQCGQCVIIKSDRGQEMGTLVGACPGGKCYQSVPDKIVGEVLRLATHADEVEARHLHESEAHEAEFCKERIAAHNLTMKLVSVEHLFGGDRVIFYFVADKRVDFRALVRDLAREFQTRIEMRQIGVRDEARLLGDYERCGRPLCCRTWIKDLAPVSMKMAKVQKATLDPTKISGQCGRLMCCLRFEHATYTDLKRSLPRKNTLVRCHEGVGKVVDSDIVTQIVSVVLQGGTRVNVPVESLLERDIDPKELGHRGGSEDTSSRGRSPGRDRDRDGSDKGGGEDKSRGEAKPSDAEKPSEKKSDSGGKERPRSRRRRGRRRSKRGGRAGASGRGKSGGGGGGGGGNEKAGGGSSSGP